jgi:hypothetical protein
VPADVLALHLTRVVTQDQAGPHAQGHQVIAQVVGDDHDQLFGRRAPALLGRRRGRALEQLGTLDDPQQWDQHLRTNAEAARDPDEFERILIGVTTQVRLPGQEDFRRAPAIGQRLPVHTDGALLPPEWCLTGAARDERVRCGFMDEDVHLVSPERFHDQLRRLVQGGVQARCVDLEQPLQQCQQVVLGLGQAVLDGPQPDLATRRERQALLDVFDMLGDPAGREIEHLGDARIVQPQANQGCNVALPPAQ